MCKDEKYFGLGIDRPGKSLYNIVKEFLQLMIPK
jgi:hypothetical protein